MIDAVLSVHRNPLTCGTAKFSQQLACRLGVPFGSVCDAPQYQCPLLSVRFGELQELDTYGDIRDTSWWAIRRFAVLWHDRCPGQAAWNRRASKVWYADELGAPSTLVAHKVRRGQIHVLTFGMAHKRQRQHLERLRDLLEASGRSYTVGVSSAIHEGSPWADTWAESDAAYRAIFGDHLRQYGFLADDGLANAIQDANVVALFYDPAVRRNNTTLWAALEQQAVVITNLDQDSPPELVHGESVYDITRLTDWPDQAHLHRNMRWRGRELTQGRYGWDALLQQLGAAVAV